MRSNKKKEVKEPENEKEVEKELTIENREIGEEEVQNKEKEEKKENVFERVKERLSMRSKKKKKEVKEPQNEKENEKEPKIEKEVKKEPKIEKEVNNELKIESAQIQENADISKQENSDPKDLKNKEKEENIFRRLIRRLSFRSKKKKDKVLATSTDEVDDKEASHTDEDIEKQNDTKSLSETSIANDMEISVWCGDDNEEKETSPSIPIINTSRPPLPTIRRPPCSATTAHSRPVSSLDAALKQFKLSTAASRENLRSSKVDISQVEEQVKAMVTSRPSTPTAGGWRSRAPAENSNLVDQWNKLSASMTDLR
eukprot:GFUD01089120.1.p1 GENE.GFUD01089120.1~~GFUD01089120.1.p1  ORF type:complete len:313 (-),score=134.53 GFUD01089120.1:138-1076(-)